MRESVKTPATGIVAVARTISGQMARGSLEKKEAGRSGPASDVGDTQCSPDYWMAAAGDAGVDVSSMPLSDDVFCQIVPVVFVPK